MFLMGRQSEKLGWIYSAPNKSTNTGITCIYIYISGSQPLWALTLLTMVFFQLELGN